MGITLYGEKTSLMGLREMREELGTVESGISQRMKELMHRGAGAKQALLQLKRTDSSLFERRARLEEAIHNAEHEVRRFVWAGEGYREVCVQLNEAVRLKRQSNPALSHKEALLLVTSENPQLARRYQEEFG